MSRGSTAKIVHNAAACHCEKKAISLQAQPSQMLIEMAGEQSINHFVDKQDTMDEGDGCTRR